MFGDGAVLLDNFNRADANPISGSWGTLNSALDLIIASNQVTGENASFTNRSYFTTVFAANCQAYISIPTLPGVGQTINVLARLKDPGATFDAYQVRYTQQSGTDTIDIDRLDDAVGTSLGTFNQELIAGDKIGIWCFDSTIQAWAFTAGAWNLIGSAVDATYPAGGYFGLGIRQNVGRMDDFFGGNVTFTPKVVLL